MMRELSRIINRFHVVVEMESSMQSNTFVSSVIAMLVCVFSSCGCSTLKTHPESNSANAPRLDSADTKMGSTGVSWAMPASPKTDGFAGLWLCRASSKNIDCDKITLPTRGIRGGCAISGKSLIFIVSHLRLYTQKISIASYDLQTQESKIVCNEFDSQIKFNIYKFAVINNVLYFSAPSGLVSYDTATGNSTHIVLHKLDSDFGVVQYGDLLLIKLEAIPKPRNLLVWRCE
jgi:hypothetical protein